MRLEGRDQRGPKRPEQTPAECLWLPKQGHNEIQKMWMANGMAPSTEEDL